MAKFLSDESIRHYVSTDMIEELMLKVKVTV
jgi:hypothetical protein